MRNGDYLLKIMDQDGNVRMYLARTTDLVEEAHHRHGTSAVASAALGRVMTAAVMMASDLKGDKDILTLRVNGGGPAGTILATADAAGGVRGLISNPFVELESDIPGKLAVGESIGIDGYLEVIKDMGLKQPFTGHVPLVSGEIAEDIAHYYLVSEQIPSLISLGVLVGPDLHIQAAGGLFIQAMPDADDAVLEKLEKQIFALGSLSNLLSRHHNLEEIIPLIMDGIPYHVIGEQELEFRCTCSRDRLLAVISGLTPESIGTAESGEGIEVVCNFCLERYLYSPREIEAATKNKPQN